LFSFTDLQSVTLFCCRFVMHVTSSVISSSPECQFPQSQVAPVSFVKQQSMGLYRLSVGYTQWRARRRHRLRIDHTRDYNVLCAPIKASLHAKFHLLHLPFKQGRIMA